jgi:hypothetical protein
MKLATEAMIAVLAIVGIACAMGLSAVALGLIPAHVGGYHD